MKKYQLLSWVLFQHTVYGCEISNVTKETYEITIVNNQKGTLECNLDLKDQFLWYFTPQNSRAQMAFPFDWCRTRNADCQLDNNNSSLTMYRTPVEAEGKFTCVGTCNSSSRSESQSIILDVQDCISIQPSSINSDNNKTAVVGQKLALKCSALVGCIPLFVYFPIFKWFHGKAELPGNLTTSNYSKSGVLTSTINIDVKDSDFGLPFTCVLVTSKQRLNSSVYLLRKELVMETTFNVTLLVAVGVPVACLLLVTFIMIYLYQLYQFRIRFCISRSCLSKAEDMERREYDVFIYSDDDHGEYFKTVYYKLENLGYSVAFHDLAKPNEPDALSKLLLRSGSVIFLCNEDQIAHSLGRCAIENLPRGRRTIIRTKHNETFEILRQGIHIIRWPDDVRCGCDNKRRWDEFYYKLRCRVQTPNSYEDFSMRENIVREI